MKSGSPIGRIIDEAGDAMVYTWAAHILGYVLNLPPGLLCLGYISLNIPMYTMEMKFMITGKLSITSGAVDIGPVEVEVILASIIIIRMMAGTHTNKNMLL